MENDDYDVILGEFKKNQDEHVESLLTVIDDDDLRNGVIAWQSVRCNRIGIGERNGKDVVGILKCPYDNHTDKWNWLWNQTKFDYGKFAIVAGLKEHEVHALLTRLIGLRLIFPDGTIATMVKAYLRGLLKKKLPISDSKGKESKE